MKYPHIVFIDFDGPLFSQRALLLPENNGSASEILRELGLNPMVSYFKMDPVAVAMLESLYQLRTFQFVIISSWIDKDMHTKEQIQRLLNINDFNIKLHKNWKIDRDGIEKPEAISKWIKENNISDYLIIDDFESCEKLNEELVIRRNNLNTNKIVILDEKEGFTMKNFYHLQAIVSNWD